MPTQSMISSATNAIISPSTFFPKADQPWCLLRLSSHLHTSMSHFLRKLTFWFQLSWEFFVWLVNLQPLVWIQWLKNKGSSSVPDSPELSLYTSKAELKLFKTDWRNRDVVDRSMFSTSNRKRCLSYLRFSNILSNGLTVTVHNSSSCLTLTNCPCC